MNSISSSRSSQSSPPSPAVLVEISGETSAATSITKCRNTFCCTNSSTTTTPTTSIYAIHKGKSIQNGIFFSWEDAKEQIENCNPPAIFQICTCFCQARQYLDDCSQKKELENNSHSLQDKNDEEEIRTGDFECFHVSLDSDMNYDANLTQDLSSNTAPANVSLTTISTTHSLPPLQIPSTLKTKRQLPTAATSIACATSPDASSVASNNNTNTNTNLLRKKKRKHVPSSVTDTNPVPVGTVAAAPVTTDTVTTDTTTSTLPDTDTIQPSSKKNKKKKSLINKNSKGDKISIMWNAYYPQLKDYYSIHGHANVPMTKSLSLEEDKSLAKWVGLVRAEYRKLKKGQNSSLTTLQMQKLSDLNFAWSPKADYHSWEERIRQLQEYKETHGNLKIPVSHPTLGEFVARIRVDYNRISVGKKARGGLNHERIQALQAIGFPLQVSITTMTATSIPKVNKSWEERFEELLEFKRQTGHCVVPQCVPELGTWVHEQRKNYKLLKSGKKSPLSTERAVKLSEIGFVFDASSRRGKRASLPLF